MCRFIGFSLGLLLGLTGCLSANQGDETLVSQIDQAVALGDPDAPVTVIEFADFACTGCRAWVNSGVKEQLQEKYGDQVRFAFENFPIRSAESAKAAEAGLCAAEQNAFWTFHDYVFMEVSARALSVDELKGYAVEIGLDSEAFDTCLDEGRYADDVAEGKQMALDVGLRGTPGFLVNDQVVPAASFEILDQAIASKLAEVN